MPKTLVSVPMPDMRVQWLTTLDCSHWTITEHKLPFGSSWPCAPCDRIADLRNSIADMEAGNKILRERLSEKD